jgi:hypothetical protein
MSHQPTPTGGRSSGTEDKTSSTLITERFLTFQVEKILKDKKSSSITDTTEPTRDGELSILTRRVRDEPRDLTLLGASISTDHSTSDQDSQ